MVSGTRNMPSRPFLVSKEFTSQRELKLTAREGLGGSFQEEEENPRLWRSRWRSFDSSVLHKNEKR